MSEVTARSTLMLSGCGGIAEALTSHRLANALNDRNSYIYAQIFRTMPMDSSLAAAAADCI